MKHKKVLILMIMSVMLLLNGCTTRINISKLTDSTVIVSKEGEIMEVGIEEFGDSHYSFDDLSAFVNDTAKEFNERHADSRPAITVGTMKEVDEKARVEMTYADAKAYEAFHGISFMNTDILGLSEEARALTYITRDTGEEVDVSSLTDSDKYKAIVTDSSLSLMIEGKIECCSDNVEVLDKNHVKTTDGLSVILYK